MEQMGATQNEYPPTNHRYDDSESEIPTKSCGKDYTRNGSALTTLEMNGANLVAVEQVSIEYFLKAVNLSQAKLDLALKNHLVNEYTHLFTHH